MVWKEATPVTQELQGSLGDLCVESHTETKQTYLFSQLERIPSIPSYQANPPHFLFTFHLIFKAASVP